MPIPPELNRERFERFKTRMFSRGFHEISPTAVQKEIRELKLQPPSPRKGREIGFHYWNKGLEVVVWTTFVEGMGALRERDAGWVLLKEGNEARHFKIVIRRRRFFYHLLGHARVAQMRAQNRPICPECGRYMSIRYGRALKSRFWGCLNHAHRKTYCSWNHGLSKEALEFLKPSRASRRRYRKRLKVEGKSSGAAMRKRKGWRPAESDNLPSHSSQK